MMGASFVILARQLMPVASTKFRKMFLLAFEGNPFLDGPLKTRSPTLPPVDPLNPHFRPRLEGPQPKASILPAIIILSKKAKLPETG